MPTGRYRLQKSARKFDKVKVDEEAPIPGELGVKLNGQEVVDVPSRKGYVYVRLLNNLSNLTQVFNDQVMPIYGLPVMVGRDKKHKSRYHVIDRDVGRYLEWGTEYNYVSVHGDSHSFNSVYPGRDVVWVYGQQFMPLLAVPSGTSTSSVYLEMATLNINDSWLLVGGTGTPSLSPYKPTDNTAKMVLIYVDINGNPKLSAGNSFSATITGSAGVYPYVPSLPDDGIVPVAAVRLLSGTSVIGWDNIYDLRQFLSAGLATGTSTGGGGSSVSVETASALVGTVLLDTTVGVGGQSSFVVNSLPTGSAYIQILIHGTSSYSGGATDGLLIAFNDDTTAANYRTAFATFGPSSSTGQEDSQNIAGIATSATPAMTGIIDIIINNPHSTLRKNAVSRYSRRETATNIIVGQRATQWENTADITKISLTLNSTGTFAQGTRCMIISFAETTLVTDVTGGGGGVGGHTIEDDEVAMPARTKLDFEYFTLVDDAANDRTIVEGGITVEETDGDHVINNITHLIVPDNALLGGGQGEAELIFPSHGGLAGLLDDDHPQYHNDARANTWLASKEAAYSPSSMTVTYGTLISGTVAGLAAVGGTDVIIAEAASANALQVSLGFTGTSQVPNNLLIYGNYNGGSGHQLAIEIYNSGTSSYDQIGIMAHSTTKQWLSFAIFNGGVYVNSGAVTVRLRHLESGNITHRLNLDQVLLQKTLTTGGGTVEDHGSLTGLSDNDHPQYSLATHAHLVIVSPTNLVDTLGNTWNNFAGITGTTYTFRPADNSNLWPTTATAVILFMYGTWAGMSAANTFQASHGGGLSEVQIREQVAGVGLAMNGICGLTSGTFNVSVTTTNLTAGTVRLLGYFST